MTRYGMAWHHLAEHNILMHPYLADVMALPEFSTKEMQTYVHGIRILCVGERVSV